MAVWQWRWNWTLDGAAWAINVCHILPDTPGVPPGQGNADALAGHLSASATHPGRGIAPRVVLATTELQQVDLPNQPVFSADVDQPGTATVNDINARASALCFRLRTTGAFNGRIYLSGISEGISDNDGMPDSSEVDLMVGRLNELRVAITADTTNTGGVWAVYSRKNDALALVTQVGRSLSSSGLGFQTQRRRRSLLR